MPTVSYRDNHPAVNVKDQRLYWRDPNVRPMLEQLGEQRAEAIYQETAEFFWNETAPEIAREHGYTGEVYSAGRSGGWLYVNGVTLEYELDEPRPIGPLDEWDTEAFEARDQFLKFAEAIDKAVDEAGDDYVYRLGQALEDDAREAIERFHWAARDVVTI
jgi:hypothetical protein